MTSHKVKVLFVVLTIGILARLPAQAPEEGANQTTVLLIGNSMIYYNRGLARMIEQLAASANPPVQVRAVNATISGSPINIVWDRLTRADLLPKDRFDVIVIQDTLGFYPLFESTPRDFAESAHRIAEWAAPQGSRIVLLMEHIYESKRQESLSQKDRAKLHTEVAIEIGADIAPALVAWERLRRERPNAVLSASDGIHPSIAGSYLIACVLYSTILNKDPTGLPYHASDVRGEGAITSPEDAVFLQMIAWESSRQYQEGHVAE